MHDPDMCMPCVVQAFHQYIEPSMQWADIVVPQGAENKVAMQLIVHHVKDQLKKVNQIRKMSFQCSDINFVILFLYSMASMCAPSSSMISPMVTRSFRAPSTSCLASLRSGGCTLSLGKGSPCTYTHLLLYLFRNRETKRDDFVFYTNRLACLVMEYALSFLPFEVRCHVTVM